MAERTSTDITKLEKKYEVIKRRQSQAKIMPNKAKIDASFGKQKARSRITNLVIPPAPNMKQHPYEIPSSNAVNHLYVRPDDERRRKNRHVVPYGTTLFADDPQSSKSATSPLRYAGAYFISASTSDDHNSSPLNYNENKSSVTKITFTDSESDSESDEDEAETPTVTTEEVSDGNNNDISKTLLELHLEWKDKQSNGEESSDSNVSHQSLSVPRNPFTAPSQPIGIGSFTTDDIKRSEPTREKNTAVTASVPPDNTPIAENKEDQKVEISTKPKVRFFPQHMRKEKREFGIKLGIYKPSDFVGSKPKPIRPPLTHDGNAPRITRHQINNCLTRESFASASWDRKITIEPR